MGLLNSFTRTAGVNSLPWVEAFHPSGATTGALAANQLYLARLPREPITRTITSLKLYVGTASGNVDVGMWSFDGTTLTLLSSSGSTAVAGSSAWQTIALLAAQKKTGGLDYFFGLCPDNATATFGRVGGTGNLLLDGFTCASKGTMFPLASNATSLLASGLIATAVASVIRGV